MAYLEKDGSFGQYSPLFIAFAAGIGLFLSTLDSGVTNIALPFLAKQFNVSVNLTVWTITIYALVLSATIMLFGKLSDRFGCIRIYTLGLIVFGIASLLCGLASDMTMLIVFRGFQGVGAALMQASSLAIVVHLVPEHHRGRAMAFIGIMIGLGPTLGPVFGGVALSLVGWRWIFLVNIPICIIGLFIIRRLLPYDIKHPSVKPNIYSVVMTGITILSLLLSLEYFGKQGLGSTTGIVLFVIFVLAFILMIVRESRAEQPMLVRTLYKDRNFILPVLTMFIVGGTITMVFMTPGLFFNLVHHYSAWTIGLIGLVTAFFFTVSNQIVGRIVGKVGTKPLMSIGAVLMGLTFLVLFLVMKQDWGWLSMVPFLAIFGIGAGLFQTPGYMHIMGVTPADTRSTASAFIRMLQNAGISVAALISAVLVGNSVTDLDHTMHGFHMVWLIGFIGIALQFLMVLGVSGKKAR